MSLKEKIQNRSANVLVVGGGYVGLPLAVRCAEAGFTTAVYDLDEWKIEQINNGVSYIGDVCSATLKQLIGAGKIFGSSNPCPKYVVGEVDVVLICVPTPLDKTHEPDVSYVMAAAETIKLKTINEGEQLVVLESTVYPGFTKEALLPTLDVAGLGKDFFVAFSPERVDPGNLRYNIKNTPKVVGGCTKKCTEVATTFYSQVVDKVVSVSSTEAAEMTKILENTFRMINIGLTNEIALLCSKLGVNVWEVVDAAATKPFGFMKFTPGPGIGGHCLDQNEWVYCKINGVMYVEQIKNVYEIINNEKCESAPIVEVLSFNGKCFFWDVATSVSRRIYNGDMVRIKLGYNYELSTTDEHILLKIENDKICEMLAKNVAVGDLLPIYSQKENYNGKYEINILEVLSESQMEKIRVKLTDFAWEKNKSAIYEHFVGDRNRLYDNYKRSKSLPALVFMHIKEHLSFDFKDLVLSTGRGGGSYSEFPCVIKIDENFCRMIGYYLSEGCITLDKSYRVRFTFGIHEHYYIEDLKDILEKMSIKYSIWVNEKDHNYNIKVSSNIFGDLLKNYLSCGVDCYSKRVPNICFSLPISSRENVISGLIRGDGSASLQTRLRTYVKNNKSYTHNNNSTNLSFFSSSEGLTRDLGFLLQGIGIIPRFFRKKDQVGLSLEISLPKYLEKLVHLFPFKKGDNIRSSLSSKIRFIKSPVLKEGEKYNTLPVRSVLMDKVNEYVYSLETDSQMFVAGNGVLVHNCIKIDPHYLSWKLKTLGSNSRFIQLAEEINSSMPRHVVDLTVQALNQLERSVKGSHILIVGVAYKPNISDVRESPALDVMETLKERGAYVSFYDPYVDKVRMSFGNVMADQNAFSRTWDCAVIITNHDNIDYNQLVNSSRIVVDTRNSLENIKTEVPILSL